MVLGGGGGSVHTEAAPHAHLAPYLSSHRELGAPDPVLGKHTGSLKRPQVLRCAESVF